MLGADARALSAAAAEEEAAALAASEAELAAEAELYSDAPEAEATEPEIPEPDPLEGMNRALFGFNEAVDRFAMEPIARVYGWIVPDPAKRAVVRVFDNLNAPVVFVNDVLQLSPRRAGETLTRFVVNSTVGIAGVLDVATRIGIEGHHADFGQTLGVAGVPTGPYLVLPIAGPSSARDAFGGIIDLALRPQTYFLGPIDLLIIQSGDGVATREAYIEELENLRESSLDFYATMRNIYFQRRAEIVRAARDGGRTRVAGVAPAAPDESEEARASEAADAPPASGSAAPAPPASAGEGDASALVPGADL
jgi:phospholipid-binding lipoprotein MlaA